MLTPIQDSYYDLKLGSDCNSGKDLSKNEEYNQLVSVIRRVCGQTSGRVRVRTEDRHRTVVILLVYNGGRVHDLEVM